MELGGPSMNSFILLFNEAISKNACCPEVNLLSKWHLIAPVQAACCDTICVDTVCAEDEKECVPAECCD